MELSLIKSVVFLFHIRTRPFFASTTRYKPIVWTLKGMSTPLLCLVTLTCSSDRTISLFWKKKQTYSCVLFHIHIRVFKKNIFDCLRWSFILREEHCICKRENTRPYLIFMTYSHKIFKLHCKLFNFKIVNTY